MCIRDRRKGDVTSAVASVKAEDFTAGKIGDAAELIKGKVAGDVYKRQVLRDLITAQSLINALGK